MDRIHMNRRRLLQVAGAAAAASAAMPTGEMAAAARALQGEPGPLETFLYGLTADPTNLDPHVSVDGSVILLDNNLYDGLVQLKPGEPAPGAPLEVEPAIAESWEASADGLVYTFKLRPDLRFADGTPLDAAAVKFSFDRMMAIEQTASTNIAQLQTTEAVDPTTVRMTLSEPFAYFLPSLGIYAGAIVNPKVMEFEQDGDMGQDYLANNAMGSGPYVLSEWRRGEQLVLDANPNWWGAAPSLKRVIFKIVPDEATLRLQLENGDLDFISALAIPQMLTFEGKPGVRLIEAPSMLLILAYLNNEKPPLDNPQVRQAMNYAINYDEMIAELINGKGRRLHGPLPFGMEGYDESLSVYAYDPERAKELLAEAGFADGFELTLTYASEGAPGADDVALASQAYLGAVGITVNIEKVAEPTRRERIDQGNFVWSVGGWTPPLPIPPWTMSKWYDTANRGIAANRAWYTNPRVDELIRSAPTIVDAEDRIAAYREAQQIVVEEAPYILFYQANQLLAMRDNIEGFEVKPGGSQYLDFEKLTKT